MKIILLGKPIAKMRARYSRRGNIVITYDPQEDDKKTVQAILTYELSRALNSLEKSISRDACNICLGKIYKVDWWFFLPLNSSDSISSKNSKLWGFEAPTNKPDYDNLEKFYLDCANGVLWPDDRMIIDASAHKRYSEVPRVEVTVTVKEEIKLSEKAGDVLKLFSPKEFLEFLSYVEKFIELDKDVIQEIEAGGLPKTQKETETATEALTKAAITLSVFANKYAKIIKKIEKIGDIKKEYDQMISGLDSIANGDFNITGGRIA